MKLRLLILSLIVSGYVTHAQKFGVNLGYAYSINSLKYNERYHSVDERYKDLSMEQLFAPNVFVRPHFKVYRAFLLFTGADLSRFRLRCTEDIYYQTDGWIPQLYKINELHIPLGLRYRFPEYRNKHIINVYGGMFGRYFVLGKQWINPINTEPDFSGEPADATPKFGYKQKYKTWSNFMIGGQYQLKVKDWMSFNVDIYAKYISTSVYLYPPDGRMSGFPEYTNKFSLHFAVGCSFVKPDKEKEKEASKVFRLND